MNTSSHPTTDCAAKLDCFVRENPTRSLILAVGCGLAAGLLVRALQPSAPEHRMARLLDEIQDRLHVIAAPVHRHADRLVESGAGTVRNGAAHFQDLQLDRGLRNLGRRFKTLFC